MLDLLSGFVTELREAGLPVSLTEHLDAAEAVHHIPLEDREALKYALAATLVKSSAHWRAFETAFEVYFAHAGARAPTTAGPTRRAARRTSRPTAAGSGARRRAGPGPGRRRGRVDDRRGAGRAALPGAAASGDASAGRRWWPATPSTRYAGMEPGRPVGGTYYLYRTLRNLDLDGVLERLLAGGPRTRAR